MKSIIKRAAALLLAAVMLAGCSSDEGSSVTSESSITSSGTTVSSDGGTSSTISDSSSDTSSTVSSTTTKKTEPEKTPAASGFTITWNKSSDWEEGGKKCGGYEIVITNNGETVNSWTAKLTVPSGTTLTSSWNGIFSVSGTTMTVKNESYNGTIEKGKSVSFGFNYASSAYISEGKATVNGSSAPASSGGSGSSGSTASTTTKKPVATVAPAPADPSGTTPVSQHGQLSVKNGQLVDKNGKGYQLRGMSTHGLTWFPEFVNESAFKTLRDDWKTNVVRLAMYVDEWGNGQCYMNNKSGSLTLLEKGVDLCISLDMYAIIDWHVLNPGDPSAYTNEAISFFDTVSKKYAKYPNIIYEICNEPNNGASWGGSIKPYAEKVIPVIRKNDPDAVIIVGTPTWSQEIDKPLADPLSYDNIMYAFHFYAATHSGLRSNVENCVSQGLPVFVSEFGTCDASGGGSNDLNQTEKWLSYFDSNGISYCNWSICNKDETCSVLRPGVSANGNWSESSLTENGKWIRNWFRKH